MKAKDYRTYEIRLAVTGLQVLNTNVLYAYGAGNITICTTQFELCCSLLRMWWSIIPMREREVRYVHGMGQCYITACGHSCHRAAI